jgi:hypothetical protein
MKEKLFKKGSLPDGNTLCYRSEKDGHWQIPETPLIEGNIRTLFTEVYPIPFNVGEVVRRQKERYERVE